MRTRIASGGGGEAAFEDEHDEIGGICHRDGAVAWQRGESVGFAFAFVAVAGGAAAFVDSISGFVDGSGRRCVRGAL